MREVNKEKRKTEGKINIEKQKKLKKRKIQYTETRKRGKKREKKRAASIFQTHEKRKRKKNGNSFIQARQNMYPILTLDEKKKKAYFLYSSRRNEQEKTNLVKRRNITHGKVEVPPLPTHVQRCEISPRCAGQVCQVFQEGVWKLENLQEKTN